jgi:hypothetical protein
MFRIVAMTAVLALAACSAVQQPTTFHGAEGPMQVAVGAPMVTNESSTVRVTPLVPSPRVAGSRAEFVYLGLLGSDPEGRSTIRVRYEERKIPAVADGEKPDYRAELTLDLSRSRVLEFRGWRIEVLEASDSAIRYEVIGRPVQQ